MALTTKQITELRKSFPSESIQVKKGFKDEETGEQKYLTGVKPQYIFERINNVFGHDGWDFQVMQHGIEGKQTWVLGKMSIYSVTEDKANISGPIIRQLLSFKEQFGTGSYNKATPIGDAMKSAATNALEKCASLYDIAHEAYKGLIKVPEDNVLSVDQKKDVALHNLLKVCKEYKVNKEVFSKFVMNVLKEEKSHKDLTPDEIQQLIDHLEKYKAPF